jgi:tRNA nucleotidyltransferase/poly(A) polymerase
MKTYQIGGAVRDTLLCYPYVETYRVVVGSKPEAVNSADYEQVSRKFKSRKNKRPFESKLPY